MRVWFVERIRVKEVGVQREWLGGVRRKEGEREELKCNPRKILHKREKMLISC